MTSDDRGETECFRSAEAMEHTPLRPQNCLNVVGMTGDVNLELAALSQYVLVVVCLLTVGSHVGKHFISSLGPSVMQRLEISRAEYGLVFSLQGIPGAILPMLGGIAISALRLRYGLVAVVLAATTLAGQALTCVAVQGRSYWALLIGRLLFGIGEGALVVMQGAIVGKWFKQGLVSTAFGVTILCSRLSSFAGFAAPGILHDQMGMLFAMWVSAAVCGVSMIAAILYMWIETKAEEFQRDSTHLSSVLGYERYSFRAIIGEVVQAVAGLSFDFWCIAFIWSVLAGAVFALLHFAADIAQSSLHMSYTSSKTGFLTGCLLLFAGLCAPCVGWAQDRTGHRVSLIAFSLGLTCTGILIAHIFLDAGSLRPALAGSVLLAVGFAIAPVALLSCVTIIVDPHALPAALGMYKATENTVLALVHLLAGALRDLSGSYSATMLFLAMLPASGIIAAWKLDMGRSSQKLRDASQQPTAIDADALGLE